MEKLHVGTREGPELWERLMSFIDRNRDLRISISAIAYDGVCSKCKQPIQIGDEAEYGGETMCTKCCRFEEEVDDECN